MGWVLDFLNPFTGLQGAIGGAIQSAWVVAMLALWAAGLWVFSLVMHLLEYFLTPDLSASGPLGPIIEITAWLGLALFTAMFLVQLAFSLVTFRAQTLARAVAGSVQFVLIVAVTLSGASTIMLAANGLTVVIRNEMIGPEWSDISTRLFHNLSPENVADGAIATVMGMMGVVLFICSLGMIFIYLFRAASMLLIVATTPLVAAGLVADAGRNWFWKALRWFIVLAFTPTIITLVLGISVSIAEHVLIEGADSLGQAIGTAVPAIVLIAISVVSPLALFRLLAFVDPGTSSGASLRAGINQSGGVGEWLKDMGSRGANRAADNGQASKADASGKSAGEGSAEQSAGARTEAAPTPGAGASSSSGAGSSGGSSGGFAAKAGPALAAVGAVVGAVNQVGKKGASIMADVNNQAGAGHQNYYPDFTGPGEGRAGARRGRGRDRGGVPVPEQGSNEGAASAGGDGGGGEG